MEYLTIQGTYTYSTHTNYGIQDILCELNDAGVPTKVLTNHQIRFTGKGDYVDTGVAILDVDDVQMYKSPPKI